MKKIIIKMLFTSMLAPLLLLANSNEKARIEDATDVILDIMDIPEQKIHPELLDDAYGIAVIPGVIKVGLGVGGRHGKGILVVRTSDGPWSHPVFMILTGGSIGWQIGVQSTDIILIFRKKKSVAAILEGEFTLGADASIAAGPVGRHVGAKTDVTFKAEIYSYSQSRGLFAGLALEGAVLQIDHDANEDFYDDQTVTPDDIFSNRVQDVPACAQEFRRVLTEYVRWEGGE
jgi:lipid-binding SYLF domain-containing protein